MKNFLKPLIKDMKWGDLVIISLVTLTAFSLWINLTLGFSGEAGYAEIVVRGQILAKYNLSDLEQTYLSGDPDNLVTEFEELILEDEIVIYMSASGIDFQLFIKDGKIRFYESNCPDQVCVNTGFVHRSGEIAACVPAGVLVRIIREVSDDDPDFVSG